MNPDDEDDHPLKRMLEALEKKEKLNEAVGARMDPLLEQIEKEILMRLWQDVGNSPFDYYVNMLAIGEFVKALRKMRRITKLPLPLAIIVQNYLAECAAQDLVALKILAEEKEKAGME
jgi:hypothetical protein